jgi:hypothetical protein
MTELTQSVLAYLCSAGAIGLMLWFAMSNRKAGWRRRRHANCFTWFSAAAATSTEEHVVAAAALSKATTAATLPFSNQLLALRHVSAEAAAARGGR